MGCWKSVIQRRVVRRLGRGIRWSVSLSYTMKEWKMAMPSCLVSSSSMKVWKWPLSPYKGKWQQTFSELQAIETLKKKVSEEKNTPTNFISILTDCFRSYDSNPSPSAYSFIIKYLFKRRLLMHVPQILDHLEKVERFDVPERIFVNVMRDYGRVDMLQDAVDIFFRIPKFRCTPSVISLNSLLSILCKKKEGLLLVREVLMKTPEMNVRLEVSTFRILIRALCRNGKLCSAVELLNMMPLHECTPDGSFYSVVLRSLCKQAGSSEVMDFLEDMQNAGFLPTAMEYNSVIDVLVREGKVDDAYYVFSQMKSEGKRPDIVSYNSILDGFISGNNFHMADELFDEMLLMGLVPDACTYNTYIKGLCKQVNLEQACKMVSYMEKAGCKPDLETFNTLVDGHLKAGRMEKARDLMSEILKKGYQWDSHTYTILIQGLLDEGGVAEAYQLATEMICKGLAPGPSTFNALVCGLCEKDLLSEAMQVHKEMTRRSITPDARSWEALLVGFKLSCVEISVDLEDISLEPSSC